MTGRVVHFELPFDDRDRATGFYRDVFGWTLQDMPGLDYVGALTGPLGPDGRPSEPGYIGGGMTSRGGVNAAPLVTLEADDIDATLAEVAARGGEVLQERFPIGDMGFAAYFRDPEGNVVGLWQGAAPAAG